MAVKWTPEQKQVIDIRNRNLLVSAAAGSGKTAVLVAHILALLQDERHPVDIDRLLIVTFTKAAASEMRGRISEAIREEVKRKPNDMHMLRQLTLIHRAQICTIDSFCAGIVRGWFHRIDLDPAFRVADDSEHKLLLGDTLEKVLEEEYLEGTEEFLDFTENFAHGKSDSEIDDAIRKLYEFSQSAPDPEKFLRDCLVPYQAEDPETLENAPWFVWYLSTLKLKLHEVEKQAQEMVKRCTLPDGPAYCYEVYSGDAENIRHAAAGESYLEIAENLKKIVFPKKPTRKKAETSSPESDKEAADIRAEVKKSIGKLQEQVSKMPGEILRELHAAQTDVKELVRLTVKFSERFSEAKREKGLVDFGDLSHMALRILIEDGKRTEVAEMLSENYEEIMIDEYQDSNEVQELLLTAVSRTENGTPNIFMVGDMKQSIYRFRMARPELFVSKYEQYTKEESLHQKIELHMNFRSRKTVLDAANFFFGRIMQASVGSIDYTEEAALHAGASYPPYTRENGADPAHPEREAGIAEMMLLDLSETDSDGEDRKAAEREARMIAAKILRLTDPENGMYVSDDGKYRPAQYRDIVILLRSGKEWTTAFTQVLEEAGIPVYAESKNGFYDTTEVRLVLNLLQLIDNPMDDVALAAVLNSPVFSFSAGEMAQIRLAGSRKTISNGFYGAMKAYEGPLRDRIDVFLERMERYRRKAAELPLAALLRYMMADLKIVEMMTAMPGGLRRRNNLSELIAKAESFEKTSYHGIFRFIRYIEKMKQYAVEEGEAGAAGENDNTVRLMTIHKSKGLEFPIVFVAGCGKQFNKADENSSLVLQHDFGIGIDAIDHRARVKKSTLIRQTVREKLDTDSLGEEIRVLYVAMTRAKEKLFITGCLKKKPEENTVLTADGKLTYLGLKKAKCYLDWLLPVYEEGAPVKMYWQDPAEIFLTAADAYEKETEKREHFEEELESTARDERIYRALEETLRYPYHYDDLSGIYASMSVSALKAAAMEKNDGMPAGQALLPGVRDEERGITGAERGTLYHEIMEQLDPHIPVSEQLDKMQNEGLISAAEKATINAEIPEAFFRSELGKRFIAAYDKGKSYREKQFIIGMPVREVFPEKAVKDPDEPVMIQGIIDLFFEEEDGLVLADYKTDRVNDAETLVKRYRVQLEYYKKALEQATGKKVKEMWIYSFALGKEILL